MKSVVASMLLACALLSLSTVAVRADCRCVANGVRFDLGQVACIKLPIGTRLARCEKVLNNSSWTVLRNECPQTASYEAGGFGTAATGLQ